MSETVSIRKTRISVVFGFLFLLWSMGLIFLVEPSPLKTPDSVVGAFQSLLRLTEPQARVFATIFLRSLGVGLLGFLFAGTLQTVSLKWALPMVMVLAPLFALGAKWIQYGYFPIHTQIVFIVVTAGVGGIFGLSLRHRGAAIVTTISLIAAILTWGMPKRVSDDLDAAARATGLHLLSQADRISTGDQAFTDLLRLAFAFAEDNSHGASPIVTNQAAILALGVVLGEDKIARLGGRELDPKNAEQREAMRRRVTAHGRSDLPRHFCVSAALTVLSGEERALAVGIAKEVADSLPDGSGFSFVDMIANQSGIRFAVVATQNSESARRFQLRMLNPSAHQQFIPDIAGIPEGISAAELENDYGGLGGAKSRDIFAEISRRIGELEELR